jgi:predicted  nucleic acid-binding Zn-ribbon protein
MTLTLPWQGTGSHRAVDQLAVVNAENAKLRARQAEADRYFNQIIADNADVHALWQYAEHKAACAENVVVCQEATIRDLERQISELKERLTVAVKADAAAARTQEIDVRSLTERFASGPVVSLHHSPQAAVDPAHIPFLVPDTDTVKLPVLADRLVQGAA